MKIGFLLFSEIVRLAKGENETQLSKMTQCEQDTYEMQVRASNIGKFDENLVISKINTYFCFNFTVRAGESLMKLVSDIKQYLILNDFHSVNDAICSSSQLYRSTQMDRDNKLMMVRDDMAADLYDLEEVLSN